jgi:photosystem II stability/assembly factor-like uncharacterized protein
VLGPFTSIPVPAPEPLGRIVGTGGELVALGGGKHILRSSDSGATWTAMNNGLGTMDVRALLVDPVTTSIVYAGTPNNGIYGSTDGGATWAAANNYFLYSRDNQESLQPLWYSISLSLSPAAHDTVYAGTWYYGVLKTTTGGQ